MSIDLHDNQAMFSFAEQQAAFVETEIYKIQYPDIMYPRLLTIDTSAPEWAPSVYFYTSDKVGNANWLDSMADDIPIADVNRKQFQQGIETAGIGYGWNMEELGVSSMIPGYNLTMERAEAARRTAEEFVDRIVRIGDPRKDVTGLFNNPSVTVTDAPATGSGGSTLWINKTGDQICADINSQLTQVYAGSLTVEIADTVLLPYQQLNLLSTIRMSNTMETALEYLRHANVYTSVTQRPLTILGALNLSTAGGGGSARMMAYRNDRGVVKLHYPMPHRFLDVFRKGSMTYHVPGIMRLGGVEVRRPAAVAYLDEI